MPVVGDEDVVLDADAAEAEPLLDLGVVDKVRVPPFRPPLVDERRVEVDARLDRHHVARPEVAGEAEVLRPELITPLGLVAVADAVLAQPLHVVHVEAQGVAQAVREEQRVRAGLDDVLRRSA